MNKRSVYFFALIVVFGAANLSKITLGANMSSRLMDDFEEVSLDSDEQHECSPVIDEFDFAFKGIKINTPSKIKLQSDSTSGSQKLSTRWPLCIAMQFPATQVYQYSYVRSEVSVVVVYASTGESYSARLTSTDIEAPLPKPTIDQKQLENSINKMFFNVDVTHYVDIRPHKGRYIIYALFDEYKSNVMSVEIF